MRHERDIMMLILEHTLNCHDVMLMFLLFQSRYKDDYYQIKAKFRKKNLFIGLNFQCSYHNSYLDKIVKNLV